RLGEGRLRALEPHGEAEELWRLGLPLRRSQAHAARAYRAVCGQGGCLRLWRGAQHRPGHAARVYGRCVADDGRAVPDHGFPSGGLAAEISG
ncbi:unnamed protein product, partial [Symbiodinium sp. CCMP2456]